MSVYFIVQIKMNNPEGYAEYAKKAAAAGVPGMKLLAMDDHPQNIEGDWAGPRTVMLEFESEENFRQWYDSPAYQEAVKLRWAATESNAVLVKGV